MRRKWQKEREWNEENFVSDSSDVGEEKARLKYEEIEQGSDRVVYILHTYTYNNSREKVGEMTG